MASGVAGEASRGMRPVAQALEPHQHTLFSHLKCVFKQKFIPKYA